MGSYKTWTGFWTGFTSRDYHVHAEARDYYTCAYETASILPVIIVRSCDHKSSVHVSSVSRLLQVTLGVYRNSEFVLGPASLLTSMLLLSLLLSFICFYLSASSPCLPGLPPRLFEACLLGPASLYL